MPVRLRREQQYLFIWKSFIRQVSLALLGGLFNMIRKQTRFRKPNKVDFCTYPTLVKGVNWGGFVSIEKASYILLDVAPYQSFKHETS